MFDVSKPDLRGQTCQIKKTQQSFDSKIIIHETTPIHLGYEG